MGKLPEDILNCYEVLNSRHAVEILTVSYPAEYEELIGALRAFRLSRQDILAPGGNESTVPRRLSALLRPLAWYETRITGDLVVRLTTTRGPETLTNNLTIPNYLDGHKIDYVKNGVAFDVE
jgi:hypothetical protein